MKEVKIEYINIDDIQPYANNPRVNDEAVEKVARSIEEYGFKVPMVLDKNNNIITGHTRFRASKRLGLKEVPCIVADDLDEDKIKEFRLVDNKVGEIAEWDEELLELELLELDKKLMEEFGFDDEEEEEEEKELNVKRLKSMEIKAFEHYDYVVFVFRNQQDWLKTVNDFGLERVDAGYGKTKKVGVGRVIDGKRLLERVEHKDPNNQQEQMEDDK